MSTKKPKQSKMEPRVISQCPECFGIEMQYGESSYSVKTRPSVVLFKDETVEKKLCFKCVSKLQID